MLDKSPGRPRASRSPLFWIIYLHFLLLCRNITALSAHQSGRIVKWWRSAKSPNNGLVYPCLTGQSLSILKSAERAREWDVISSRLLQHRLGMMNTASPSESVGLAASTVVSRSADHEELFTLLLLFPSALQVVRMTQSLNAFLCLHAR